MSVVATKDSGDRWGRDHSPRDSPSDGYQFACRHHGGRGSAAGAWSAGMDINTYPHLQLDRLAFHRRSASGFRQKNVRGRFSPYKRNLTKSMMSLRFGKGQGVTTSDRYSLRLPLKAERWLAEIPCATCCSLCNAWILGILKSEFDRPIPSYLCVCSLIFLLNLSIINPPFWGWALKIEITIDHWPMRIQWTWGMYQVSWREEEPTGSESNLLGAPLLRQVAFLYGCFFIEVDQRSGFFSYCFHRFRRWTHLYKANSAAQVMSHRGQTKVSSDLGERCDRRDRGDRNDHGDLAALFSWHKWDLKPNFLRLDSWHFEPPAACPRNRCQPYMNVMYHAFG